ncbi:YihY/virulence factor BrkB family protein [Marinitenerispora sediminis]|uniref:Ribonuclease BN n=1 Tax=Marinitenerispora sediminis TaxID=1931232 RepID=A0A368T3M5_9ACTN|nr:YihY/virulence factor BrkB family protein [Marinitenerispora sediminis]RCV49662.1 ribonuclease BN [Marinitenerispora sediminis]RCV53189.1 ribonuclease BN [Marinitenerispora sediminis]RCV57313.1 ribonuclease BN [Marinitenerispora sediminis]
MEAYWSLRRNRPVLDHLVRAVERYTDRRGDSLAASVTYYAFLSFFPLLALGFSVLGYVAEFNIEARTYLEQAVWETLPGLAEGLPLDEIARARAGAGALGLLGLLYAGLGSVAALREALHAIWLRDTAAAGNPVLTKLGDAAVTAVLGGALLASVALTGIAQAATGWLLSWFGLDGSLFASITLRGLGLLIAVGMDILIFFVLFARLSGAGRPWGPVWRGALLAAVGFEALKATGALLISGTLSNPVYASFAVLAGLLVWINIVLRFLLFTACWAATWLPVPPPYQGAPPMAAGPVAAPELPAAPDLPAEPERPAGPRADHRGRRPRAVLPRAARAAAAGAAAAGWALWARERAARRAAERGRRPSRR